MSGDAATSMFRAPRLAMSAVPWALGALTLTLGACSAPRPYWGIPPGPPIELGTETVEWRGMGLGQTIAMGPSYAGFYPPFDRLVVALGPRYWAAVIDRHVPVIPPKEDLDHEERAAYALHHVHFRSENPLFLRWKEVTKEKAPLLFVLDRVTGSLSSATLPGEVPAERERTLGDRTLRIEGDRARLSWIEDSEPLRVGLAEMDLPTATWTEVRVVELPPSSPGWHDAGAHVAFALDGAVAVVRNRWDRGGISIRISDAPAPAAAASSRWERLGDEEQRVVLPDGTVFVMTLDRAPSAGDGALRPAKIHRIGSGTVESAPFSVLYWEPGVGSADIRLFSQLQANQETSFATLDTSTLAQTALSGCETRPWSSGLSVDFWGAHGKQVAQLATVADGRIVARVFTSGTGKPSLEVPAPADFLAAVEGWRDPTPVRSDREICLLGGTARMRRVHSGLCFDLQTRSYRVVKVPPVQLHGSCAQLALSGSVTVPLIDCHHERRTFLSAGCTSNPPHLTRMGWEILGMRTSAGPR